MAASLAPEIKAAAAAAAEIVAENARGRVPVVTGALRDAIHVDSGPAGAYVVAGNRDAFYGHIVEHGSVYTPPHPFLVPALEESRGEIVVLMEEAIRKAT